MAETPDHPGAPPEGPASEHPDPDFDAAAYLPRTALTVGPEPQKPVILEVPAGIPDGRYQAELTLFIDERGSVRRVLVHGADLPQRLLDHARQAFLTTFFYPGQLDGQAVRAQVKILVEFESNSGARAAGGP